MVGGMMIPDPGTQHQTEAPNVRPCIVWAKKRHV